MYFLNDFLKFNCRFSTDPERIVKIMHPYLKSNPNNDIFESFLNFNLLLCMHI
jgi:hypothetical protein